MRCGVIIARSSWRAAAIILSTIDKKVGPNLPSKESVSKHTHSLYPEMRYPKEAAPLYFIVHSPPFHRAGANLAHESTKCISVLCSLRIQKDYLGSVGEVEVTAVHQPLLHRTLFLDRNIF